MSICQYNDKNSANSDVNYSIEVHCLICFGFEIKI